MRGGGGGGRKQITATTKKKKSKNSQAKESGGSGRAAGAARGAAVCALPALQPQPLLNAEPAEGKHQPGGTPTRCQSRPGRIAPLPPARGWRSHSPQCPPGANPAQHPGSPTPSPSSASRGGGLSRLAGSDCRQL